ncbi:hypothetical protein PARMER_00096 [Parabacteroides merdae ATCC 43184]|nr:hypothetical protein PARMER_00096 [Parabacteroides merdae ATCC 43184]
MDANTVLKNCFIMFYVIIVRFSNNIYRFSIFKRIYYF